MNTAYTLLWGREGRQKPPVPLPLFQFPFLALILFIAFVGASVPTTSFAAKSIAVTPTNGCTIDNAVTTVINNSNTGGCTISGTTGDYEISISDGTYETKDLEITADVTINGTSKTGTIIQYPTGDTTVKRVLKITSGATVNINNVTIQNGTSGNLYVDNSSTLNLTDAEVLNGSGTDNGGGLKNFGTSVLTNVTLTSNSTTGNLGSGGGIYTSGSLTLDNVSITDNSTDRKGGGVFVFSGSIDVKNSSKIEGNTSQLCGAGIQTKSSDVTIANSTLQNNLYKGSSPSDLVSSGSLSIGDGSGGEKIQNSYIGAYIDSCYKSVFLLIDDFVEDTTDSVDITKDDLEDALGTGSSATIEEDNMDGYKERIKNELNNDLSASVVKNDNTTVTGSSDTEFKAAQTELENLVNSVNNGTSKIADFIDNDTTNSLTDEQLLAELKKAGLKNIVDANVDKYRAALTDGSLTKTDGDTVAELQVIIDTTNLEKIQSFAGGSGDLVIEQLTGTDKLTGVDPNKLDEYKAAIKQAGSAGIGSWEALQAIINQVNNSNTNTSDSTSSSGGFGTPPPQPDYYQLNIASPNGRVTSDKKDINGNAIDCNKGSGYCGGLFKRGTTIKLTATAPTGLIFDSWDGSPDCLDGKVTMNNSRNCKALFYGDPDYVPPEEEDDTTGSDGAGTGDTGTGDATTGTGGTTNPVYVDSFSIRAKIQGKNACYQDANPHPNDVVVAGFILQGAGTEQVLIRALDLEQDVNPKIIVKQTILGADGLLRGVNVAKNDAWELNPRSTDIPDYYKPDRQTDAALLLDLPAGAYTVTMCMSPNSKADSGVALVSVTLLDNALTFSNVSGRGYVSGGANDAITGFTVYGADGRKTARIKGHALGETAETQIDSAIEVGRIYFDPQINQVTGSRLKNVSNWREEPSINDLPLDNELADTDAAVSMSFDPGSYTMILSSENGVPGLGITYIEFMD